jgi:hypothetical protein
MSAKSCPSRNPYDLSSGNRLSELRSGKVRTTAGGSNPYTGATKPNSRPERKTSSSKK